MTTEDLKKSVKEMKMTDEAKQRIVNNIRLKTNAKEDSIMKNTNRGFKRILLIAAIIVICAFSVGAGVIHHLRGFGDVVKDGAVVDTVFYEDAEMIELEAQVGDELVVTANMLDCQNVPYSELEEIESMYYFICNNEKNDEIIEKGRVTSSSAFENGRVTFVVPIENIPEGEYVLVAEEFVGTKKADRPLPIRGRWVCSFTK